MNSHPSGQSTFRVSATEAVAAFLLSPAGLVLLFVCVYLLPLGFRPLGIPDEMRYAEIARGMLVSGDWIVPRLNGLLYFEKPTLGHWLNALSIGLLGETNFAVRLPSALAAGLTTTLLWWFTHRVTLRRDVAGVVALMHLTAFGVYFIGTYAVLDTLLTTTLTATFLSFFAAVSSEPGPRQTWLYVACGICVALAFLTKGFLAFVVPGLALVPWLVWTGHARVLLGKAWLVVLIAVLLVLPWALAIHRAAPDFWRYFIIEEHLHRFTAEDAQHRAPVYYFLMALPLLTFPWILLLPAMYRGFTERPPWGRTAVEVPRLLWLWVLLPFLFFSLSKGKIETYVLPLVPPLCVIGGVLLVAGFERGAARRYQGAALVVAALWGGVLLYLLIVQLGLSGSPLYGAGEGRAAVLFAGALILSLVLALVGIRASAVPARIVFFGLSVVPFTLSYALALPGQVIERKAPEAFLRQMAPRVQHDTVLLADTSLVHAVAWIYQRTDIYLLNAGELDYGLAQPGAERRLLDVGSATALVDSLAPGEQLIAFVRNDEPAWLQNVGVPMMRTTWGRFSALVFTGTARR